MAKDTPKSSKPSNSEKSKTHLRKKNEGEVSNSSSNIDAPSINQLFEAIKSKDINSINSTINTIEPNLLITKDEFGRTVLHTAILLLPQSELDDVIKLLINKNKELINVKSIIGQNIIQYALNHNKPDIAKSCYNLLRKSPEFRNMLMHQDVYGNTFLHLAAKGRHFQFIKEWFKAFGKNNKNHIYILNLISRANEKHETFIDIAKKGDHTELVEFLIRVKNIFKYGDDSSDEEDSVEDYNIKQSIEKFKKGNDYKRFEEQVQKLVPLSFITHAAGIYLLYSPKVQARYYELKHEKLTYSSTILRDDKSIESQLKTMVNKVAEYAKYADENFETGNTYKLFKKIILEEIYTNIISNKIDYSVEYLKGQAHQVYFNNIFKKAGLDITTNILRGYNFVPPNPFKQSYRRTIEDPRFDLSMIPDDEFVVEFLAHLRLHNRSEKRHKKNSEPCKNTSWTITASNEKQITLENESGYSTKYNKRNEQVSFHNHAYATYQDFVLRQTENEIGILLKNRINIKKENNNELSNNILALWYLLFGCEVIKNPGAIIHHNMVLDLVEAGKLKWHSEEMINNIPVSKPGSLPFVMTLEPVAI